MLRAVREARAASVNLRHRIAAAAGSTLLVLAALPSAALANSPPTVSVASSLVEVAEGTLAVAYGSATDSDGDALTLSADLGTIEPWTAEPGATWRWSYPATDGPFEALVTVGADDGTGGVASATFTLRVANVAPGASTRGPQFVPSASVSTRAFRSGVSDPGADTVTSTMNCGTGTLVQELPFYIEGWTWFRCLFDEAGATAVGATAVDSDGAATDGRMPVTASPNVASLADGRIVVDGAAANHFEGGAVAVVDIDHDGYGDVAIGRDRPGGSTEPPGPAVVSIVRGRAGTAALDLGTAGPADVLRITADDATSYLGWSLAAAGDVNGDGQDDLVIGAPFAVAPSGTARGSAYIVFGGPGFDGIDLDTMSPSEGIRLIGASDYERAGSAVAGGGDVNGDGFDDVVVGAPLTANDPWLGIGTAYVIYGAASMSTLDLATLPSANGFRIDGSPQSPELGSAMSLADVDGDGDDDVIVGAPRGSIGDVHVVFGGSSPGTVDVSAMSSTIGFSIEGTGLTSSSGFGGSLAAADISGDGRAEIVAGLPGWDSAPLDGRGAVIVIAGVADPTSFETAEASAGRLTWIRGAPGQGVGDSVAVGDWTGDGVEDVIAGASGASENDDVSGTAFIVPMATTPIDVALESLGSWHRFDGDSGYAAAGAAVAAGDVTGDSGVDVVIGAPGWINHAPSRGRVAVLAGTAQEPPPPPPPPPPPADTAPPVGSVSIAGGSWTTTSSVTLSTAASDASGVVEMAVSNDGVGWTSTAYAPTTAWTLPAGDGSKTVSVKWRDGAGNWSAPASATIGLDQVAPAASAPVRSIRAGDSMSGGGVPIRLSWSGSDGASGVAGYDVERSVDGKPYTRVATGVGQPSLQGFVSVGHSYRFRVRAVDRAGNVGAWATGAMSGYTAFQESSARISWRGTWRTVSSTTFWGGRDRYSTTRGSTATFRVTGRGFAWIAPVGPTRGSARVYVNGVLVSTVSLRSSVNGTRRVVYSRSWSSSATRTIVIRVNGTDGHPRMDLDAIVTWS